MIRGLNSLVKFIYQSFVAEIKIVLIMEW